MNDSQRKVVAIALAVVGGLCLLKTWASIYEPSHEFLGMRTSAIVDWNHAPMGWIIAAVAAFAAAAIVSKGRMKD